MRSQPLLNPFIRLTLSLSIGMTVLLACQDTKEETGTPPTSDMDGDGYAVGDGDCDDDDPEIHPGAVEICDGIDNNCDGDVDDDDPGVTGQSIWYLDSDGDGYGQTPASVLRCEAPVGYVSRKQDCDDNDATIYPGAVSDHQGMAMAYICPGTFTMGSPEGEVGRESVEVQHEVTLTRGFYLGVYEVTQTEFEGVMGYQPSPYPACLHCAAESMEWGFGHRVGHGINRPEGLRRLTAGSPRR